VVLASSLVCVQAYYSIFYTTAFKFTLGLYKIGSTCLQQKFGLEFIASSSDASSGARSRDPGSRISFGIAGDTCACLVDKREGEALETAGACSDLESSPNALSEATFNTSLFTVIAARGAG
jgi:hypothetical protein